MKNLKKKFEVWKSIWSSNFDENQIFVDGTDEERYSKDEQSSRSKNKSNDEKLDHRIDQLAQISLFLIF